MVTEDKWTEIRLEYATTGLSYRKLAEKHGVSFNTLKARAKRENWVKNKNGYQEALTTKTLQKAATKASDTCVKQLVKVGRAAEIATSVIEKIVEDADQFRRHLIQTREKSGSNETGIYENWDVEERTYEKYDTKALRDFTAALKDLVSIIRNVYGLPTYTEKEMLELAKRRLELDTQKADIFDKSKAIEVVFVDGEDTDGNPIDGSEASG